MQEETVLSSVTDSLVDSFFKETANSQQNVLTPEEKPIEEKKEEKIKNNPITNPVTSFNVDDLVGDLLEKPTDTDRIIRDKKEEVSKDPVKVDQPKLDFDFNSLVSDGVLAGFEDDSKINSIADLKNLINGNKEQWTTEAKEQAVSEYEADIPEPLKFVIDYAKKGGSDFKTLFSLLGQNEEIREYNLEKVEDQRAIVRNYYSSQGWTEDEIDEELIGLVESERLKNASQRLKPKLDQVVQTQLQDQAKQQEYIAQQQQKAKRFYVDNVTETLKAGALGEMKLSKQDQKDIYDALVVESYDSYGGKTNRLGALLDKIQYAEPNYELLAKVTMYLSDPDGFEKRMKDGVNTEVTAKTVKKIKVDQSKQKIGSESPELKTEKLPKFKQGFVNPFE